MIKLVNMLVRDDDYMHEEFIERWRGSHAEFTREFLRFVKYATSVPTDPERSEYDGTVELYFENMAALKAASDSEVDQRVNADTAAFTDMGRGPTLYAEKMVHLDRS